MSGLNWKYRKIDKVLRDNGFYIDRKKEIMLSISEVKIIYQFHVLIVMALCFKDYSKKMILSIDTMYNVMYNEHILKG